MSALDNTKYEDDYWESYWDNLAHEKSQKYWNNLAHEQLNSTIDEYMKRLNDEAIAEMDRQHREDIQAQQPRWH